MKDIILGFLGSDLMQATDLTWQAEAFIWLCLIGAGSLSALCIFSALKSLVELVDRVSWFLTKRRFLKWLCNGKEVKEKDEGAG